MKIKLFIILLILLSICSSMAKSMDLIDNPQVAKDIAKIILIKMYGVGEIERQEPFIVTDNRDAWRITGTLKPEFLGGVAIIEIRKRDGAVIFINHGK
jgi:hypothetical protein